MNYESYPKYEIECAIINARMTTQPKNRILQVRKNWERIIYKKQPKERPTEKTRITRLEHKIFWIEKNLKHKIRNIETIINKIQISVTKNKTKKPKQQNKC